MGFLPLGEDLSAACSTRRKLHCSRGQRARQIFHSLRQPICRNGGGLARVCPLQAANKHVASSLPAACRTLHAACGQRWHSKLKSPFLPRSDVQDNDFYNPRPHSGSSHQHTPSPQCSHPSHGHPGHGHGHGWMPERSHSSGAIQRVTAPFARSPFRSHTIAVLPDDLMSQVAARRLQPPLLEHDVSPQPQYASIGAGVQLVYGQPVAYVVVYLGDRKYPEHAHATYPHCSTTVRCSGCTHTSLASEAAAAAARATRSRTRAPCARLTWALLASEGGGQTTAEYDE
ncbi:hypothetical protein GGX14DRAFT_394421 [Mycena pura]|uniref:Uncharacterized protein n=1 Tax=Mycena pura TaxID=153505 RepID=A0AAD6VEP1_9AGAR|nr:hypothetical protein GGX14DRAFT_394421 [Mycena pura]